MKKTWIWCLLALLSLVSVAWSQTGGTEKAIAALEQQSLQAQKTNNPELLVPLLPDKVVITGNAGKVTNKTETLAPHKKTKSDSVAYRHEKATTLPDAAIP